MAESYYYRVLDAVRRSITERHLLEAGDRVAVAVSGGADSVALLRILLELRNELGIVLSVAHFHHQIRGVEADADAQFVRDLAGRFGLEFHFGSGDAPSCSRDRKVSLETAARELRHRWFAQLLEDRKAEKIATAHTLDDQAETVLMRIVRGAGTRGLAAIAPVHREKHLIRPLLEVSRADIQSYLDSLKQAWREDSSNRDLSHTRNRLRHELLPQLEREFNPSIKRTLSDLAEVARAEEQFWNTQVAALLPRLMREGKPTRSGRRNTGDASKTMALDLAELRALPLALARRVLRAAVEREFGVELEFKHTEKAVQFLSRGHRSKASGLPGGLEMTLTFRELQLSRVCEDEAGAYQYRLPVPGEIEVPEISCKVYARLIHVGKARVSGYNPAQLLDRALLAPELTVRNWRAGDKFLPAHSRSPKKVKELLQPARLGRELSVAERRRWPVIESGGQIVWMRGFQPGAAVSDEAKEAVLIEETPIATGAGH